MSRAMTPAEVLIVSAMGAFLAVLIMAGLYGLHRGLYRAWLYLITRHETRRELREDLDTCHAIDALGTTDPQENP